jgi:signal transduction histidine kinase
VAEQAQILNRTGPTEGAVPQLADLALELGALAQLANAAGGAAGCLIVFRDWAAAACVWADDSGVAQIRDDATILQMAMRWSAGCGGRPFAVHRLSPSESAILRSLRIDIAQPATLIVAGRSEGPQRFAVVMVSAAAGAAARSTAELAARCTAILLRDWRHAGQASFWRVQAGLLRDTLQKERAQAARAARERARDSASKRRLAAHAARGSFAAVASALSKLGPFEGWFLATRAADGLHLTAIHGLPRDALSDPGNSIIEALPRRFIGRRGLKAGAALSKMERRLRNLGYCACLSAPLEGATLVLLSREVVTMAVRQRVASALKSIEPQLRILYLSREIERQRALSRSLVRGLFRTADAERANLRRDLHDDWAQLLAAAKIALDGRTEDARRFFRELEVELRKRLDALRPAPSPRGGLGAAITAEAQRLRTAGIDVAMKVTGVRRLPAAAREVFCRVLGEGVANVIRHAAAAHVEIELQCRAGVASLAIADDGKGIRNGAAAMGTGLRGLAERVAMLGGTCRLDSISGGTRLYRWLTYERRPADQGPGGRRPSHAARCASRRIRNGRRY